MGQIVGGAAKPKRCNLNQLSLLGTPAAGEHILVSSDNSMSAAGQGNFDCYIVGDGKTVATALELKNVETLIGVFDISSYHATGGVLAKYADLTAALNDGNNIPQSFRKGGMSVKFVQSSDNKYIQYMLVDDEWSTNEANWQKVTLETEVNELKDKLIKLTGFGIYPVEASATTVGDVYFNTSNNELKKIVSINNSNYVSETVPYYDGAIYSYNGNCYVWNGTNLVPAFKEIKIDVITTSRSKVSNGDVYYNPSVKRIYRKESSSASYEFPLTSDFVYIYENKILVWDGSDLFEISNTSFPVFFFCGDDGILANGRRINNLMPGRKYRIHLANKNVDMSTVPYVANNDKLRLSAIDSSNTAIMILNIVMSKTYEDYYDIVMPSGCYSLVISGRCSFGYSLFAYVEDIDYSTSLMDSFRESLGIIEPVLRNGSIGSLSSTKCVSMVNTYGISGRASVVFNTNRPISENCEYRYTIRTYTTVGSPVTSGGTSVQEWDVSGSTSNKYVNTNNVVAIGFCIAEYNKSTSLYNDLSMTSFDGYRIWIDVTPSIMDSEKNEAMEKAVELSSQASIQIANQAIEQTAGSLQNLSTSAKSNLVDAINEVYGMTVAGGDIYATTSFNDVEPILTIPSKMSVRITNKTITGEGLTIIGKNILDTSTLQRGKIINNSGTEVSDGGSSYFNGFIPVYGRKVVANFGVQRYYLYDINKDFIRRTDAANAGRVFAFDDNVYFIQVQIVTNQITDSLMCYYDGYGENNTFEAYTEYSDIPISGSYSIYKDGKTDISISATVLCKHIIPNVKRYAVYEVPEATDDYSCPFGQGSQSVAGLTYKGFLADYFDKYIGKYNDGYIVVKESIGHDAGNNATDKLDGEVFGYVFTPKYYNKTVLLSGGMNACELSGFFGIAYFIDALMKKSEPGYAALHDSTRFVILPVLCPSCLDSSPIRYPNYNGVRINKNFNYDGSWAALSDLNKGEFPDSEPETNILKKWISKYSEAVLWIDCHSDTGTTTYSNTIQDVLASDAETAQIMSATKHEVQQFYANKGYPSAVSRFSVTTLASYPKTIYSKQVLGIPAFMIEQYLSSCAVYGGSNNVNNDSAGIKNYSTLLRQYILTMCMSGPQIVI